MFSMRESDKHFLWSMIGALGLILFWRGVWNGIDILYGVNAWTWLATPALSFFVGLLILTFSGLLFSQFDPLGGIEKGIIDKLNMIQTHPERKDFKVTYYDKLKKEDVHINAEDIKHFEKNMLLVHSGGRESFIPIHRIKAIHKKGKIVWRM